MATGYEGYKSYGDPERIRLERQRQLAETLMAGASQTGPKTFAQGLSQLGQAFIAKGATDKADKAENAYATDKARRLAQFLNPNADAEGRNLAPDVNVSADPAPAPAQANPNIRAIATALGGVYEGDGKTQPLGMTAAPMPPMADAGAPTFTVGAPVSQPMSAPQMPKPAPDRVAALRQAMQMTGGDLEQAAALVDAKFGPAPSPDKFQFLQGPDGSLSVGNQTTGEIDRRVAGTPKPVDPVKWETQIIGNRVVAYNPQDVSQTKDMGPAPPKGAGEGGPQLTPYQQYQIERNNAADAAKAAATASQIATAKRGLDDAVTRVDSFIGSKGFEGIYGPFGAFGLNGGAKPTNVMNQSELDAMAMLDQIGGDAFLSGVAKMRGTGPLSDNEGKKVAAAVTRLTNRMQSKEAARQAAKEFQDSMRGLMAAYETESGGAPAPQQVQQPNMLQSAIGGVMSLFGGGQPQQSHDVTDLLDKYK